MTGNDLAQAAHDLVDTPFRLHGRDRRSGLDCVGVLAAALQACGRPASLPNGYTLRSRSMPDLATITQPLGLAAVTGGPQPGDVLILRPATCQLHLVIAITADTIVHAHAGLRKVVLGALPMHWPIAAHLRLAAPTVTERT